MPYISWYPFELELEFSCRVPSFFMQNQSCENMELFLYVNTEICLSVCLLLSKYCSASGRPVIPTFSVVRRSSGVKDDILYDLESCS